MRTAGHLLPWVDYSAIQSGVRCRASGSIKPGDTVQEGFLIDWRVENWYGGGLGEDVLVLRVRRAPGAKWMYVDYAPVRSEFYRG